MHKFATKALDFCHMLRRTHFNTILGDLESERSPNIDEERSPKIRLAEYLSGLRHKFKAFQVRFLVKKRIKQSYRSELEKSE